MGPHFLSLCQIWCESVQKWPSCGLIIDFKITAAAILHFCTMWIFVVNLVAGPHSQPMFQIWCKYIQKWPTYGWKCDFQYGCRRHLGFCEISILPVKPVTQPHFLALCQIWCESFQKWPRCCRSTDFKMAAGAILNLLLVTIFVIWYGWLIKFCQKIQNGGCRYHELLFGILWTPTKFPSRPEVCVKISFQSHYYFRSYGHLKILQIWLKTPIPASKIYLRFGGFWPTNIIVHHRNP